MPFKFNPFSGTFDLAGSKVDTYLDGEVATYDDLPLDPAAAPLNSAWLVREASGLWFLTRKPAGIYVRSAAGGTDRDADYTYAGTFPDVFSDANFVVYNDADSTKNVKFSAANVTTGTTRTLTVPDASGTLPLLESANTFTQNQTLDGTNNVAPNQTAASGSSIMTRDLVDARAGRVLFYRVSSALSATSTAKVFDTTTLTIPVGTYNVQAQARARYEGSNGGWSLGIERVSGNSGTATAIIFQTTSHSGVSNSLAGGFQPPRLNLFGSNDLLAANSTADQFHKTGQSFASGLLVVTVELVVAFYIAQVATDASNATTLNADSFLMLTKLA
jgi:hypothetical protein